ncbi:peptide N-myristoyltransferase 1 [Capsaspora owczarzaki ATCC 30864]|nr:peptide N-myristoyltransferase 1 [Capsaspora owczarzaki ATCC 30864]|eukprot:XP_004364075.1 peptide N-myristoyltransferase 1 [Capsaspora owczarzaki ATCC 30864]
MSDQKEELPTVGSVPHLASTSTGASTSASSSSSSSTASSSSSDAVKAAVADAVAQAAEHPPMSAEQAATQPSSLANLSQDQLAAMIQLLNLDGKGKAKEQDKEHKFWKTQPVLQYDQSSDAVEPIEPDNANIRQEPYPIPADFEWVTLDLLKEDQLSELYNLLNENYVEDDDNMFRFDYSREFLRWALLPPGWKPIWHAGVRASKSRKLVAFISAIPATLKVKDRVQPLVEINFLCVHKKLRTKRLAPVLIKEITRRVHLQGLFQAVYTAGVVLPKPFSTCRYWHRSLNPKKLIDIGFSHLGRNMTLARTIKRYKVAEQPTTAGLRLMKAADVPSAFRVLSTYLERFAIKTVYTEEEFVHWFLPRNNVISTYVVENSKHEITDLVCWYTLPSTIVNNPNYSNLKAAYSYYTVANTVPFEQLLSDALILAKNEEFDVFNALDLMQNAPVFENLKFGIGDGQLRYYFYNLKCPEVQPSELALVLL